jgi:hypothetical protein
MTAENRGIVPLDTTGPSEFKSESELAVAATAAAPIESPISRSRPDGSVSFAELRAAVSVEWYEALAIVQALCRTIIDSGDRIGPARMDLHDVFILPDGTVTATCKGPRNAAASVQCLGMILDRLLPDHDFMFLRARLVSKATSSPPHYASIEEFSDALAYYERPNRGEMIRDVYRRVSSAPKPIAAPPVQHVIGIAPPAVERPQTLNAPVDRRSDDAPKENLEMAVPPGTRAVRPSVLFGLAAGAVAGIALGVALWMRSTPVAAPLPAVSPQVETSKKIADVETPPEAPNVASEVKASGRTLSSVAMASSTGRQIVRDDIGVSDRTAPALQAPRILVRNLDAVGVGVGPRAATTLPLAMTTPVSNDVVRSPERPGVGTVYTDTDRDIVPPIVRYPNFSIQPYSGKARPDTFLIEVLVNERGRVDTARSRHLPDTVGESLFLMNTLSAAKSWRFDPALKGIYPVKYRYLLEFIRN